MENKSIFIKTFFFISILFLFQELKSQSYKLANEKIVFSFKTKNGKQVYLCKDTSNKYLVYRFGTAAKIELEFPKLKDKTSWQKFEYSFYLRGGGKENEGMDINYLAFINEQTKYVIYQNYYAVGEKYEIGIKVIDMKTNKTIMIIKGDKKTQIGTLIDFRDENLVKKSEQFYD